MFKQTKKALLLSVFMLVVCLSMLIGTTYAWFTDSASSGSNIIQAGNLKVDMVDANDASMKGEIIEFVPTDKRAQNEIFWEPGCTYSTEPVYIVNKGNLAFKYEIIINGINGNAKLLEVIEWTVTVGGVETNVEDLNGILKEKEQTGAIVITGHMKEDAGNEYQGESADGISVVVFATQTTVESDSFDTEYDKNAEYAKVTVNNANELKAALENGKSVELSSDIEVSETIIIPATTTSYSLSNGTTVEPVVIDLNGKTINGTMHKNEGAVIKNEGVLTIKNGTISSKANNGGSALVNKGTVIVEEVTLNGAPNADGSWPSYTINNTGKMTLNSCKITSYHGAVASYNEGALVILNESEIDMKGIPGFTNHGIYTYDNGEVIVNGGTYANNAADQNSTGGSVINGAVTVNGGTFTGRIENYYGTPVIKGGTFNVKVNSKFVPEGYVVVENADNTYSVAISFKTFLSKLESENYEFDGNGITVALKDSEYNYYNGSVRQYYIPASTVNINSNVETIKIKNVTFVFVDDNTNNTYVAGELQTLAKNVTFENCIFDNVSVSPWETTSGADNCETAMFTNCKWNNLSVRYGIHQSKAKSLTVTGCTFNSVRGIHVNNVDVLIVKNNKFTGIGDGYGVLCLSEGIKDTPETIDVIGNNAEGQTMLRQLSKTVTAEQIKAISDNNVYKALYVEGSIVPAN